ncbi:MAG: DUF721 domain-containing protein [Marinospirillum sp.]|uniref:DUF721 domain-containing protein n=1 Tax=Marinospirillum sp. TaxID=2183934 RepID=UPI0019FC7B6E|nr:DciA family protein [Marinospirillum sp.]MBE0505376.1 DUF721 domain-containing protein [Marinospirillum sp.]
MSIKARAGRIKSLSALINKDTSIFSRVLSKAATLKHLETLLHQELPAELRTAYRVANYEEQKLILITGSAGFLTQMRFLEPGLIVAMKKHLPDLRRIEVKIRPELPAPKPSRPTKPISPHARQILGKLAEQVDNPRLKAVLERLGKQKQKDEQQKTD